MDVLLVFGVLLILFGVPWLIVAKVFGILCILALIIG